MSERLQVDAGLERRGLSESTRQAIWSSADAILANGPHKEGRNSSTVGLALGYVQSGKTTAISALIAAAADTGYQIVVAVLGSTNLLLSQNESRLRESLSLDWREDYVWVQMTNPTGRKAARDLSEWISRGRKVLVPVLKHSRRITSVANVIREAGVSNVPALIVDDEADQASLNTRVRSESQSSTYVALSELRQSLDRHLFVQFTATPYAPLLLEPDDHLLPEFVELLEPGPGYTGGREFFVDNAALVVRPIPTLDEQVGKDLPSDLPGSLRAAFANFIAGCSMLLASDASSPPISMLVHSTHRTSVQERYFFLLERLKSRWLKQLESPDGASAIPVEIEQERRLLEDRGAAAVCDADFLSGVMYALRESTLWLVNSASAVNRVDWRVAPIHVLVGGNKLDRGFTIEGLTVTYMNRSPSAQVDTLEQRARAFGYRNDYLPYCQFFGTPETLKLLREIVDTEYDLRGRLTDWISDGKPISDWASQVGLLLPRGAIPTRQNVIKALLTLNDGPRWHQLRRPDLSAGARSHNTRLVEALSLGDDTRVQYGRLSHPTRALPLHEVVGSILKPWMDGGVGRSPGWRGSEIIDMLNRLPDQNLPVPVLLMLHPDGGPRSREWKDDVGFVNLLQGPDPGRTGLGAYAGDRLIAGIAEDPDRVVVQIHYVQATSESSFRPLYTLAVHAGGRQVVKRGRS